MELPLGDAELEGRACSCDWQHRCLEGERRHFFSGLH